MNDLEKSQLAQQIKVWTVTLIMLAITAMAVYGLFLIFKAVVSVIFFD